MILSPSKGVGIGSVWSAALDEQLNKTSVESSSSKASTSKELGKENISSSQPDLRMTQITKPAKIIIEREVLSPELVKISDFVLFLSIFVFVSHFNIVI